MSGLRKLRRARAAAAPAPPGPVCPGRRCGERGLLKRLDGWELDNGRRVVVYYCGRCGREFEHEQGGSA
jgi:hypothetical protein